MAEPLLGASIVASILAMVVFSLSIGSIIIIRAGFIPRKIGIANLFISTISVLSLWLRYPVSDNHPGIMHYMLTYSNGMGTVLGDITVSGIIWISALWFLPVVTFLYGTYR